MYDELCSSLLDSETILLYRKEVPWYLEDGTARVNVMGYQDAVSKHFKRLLSVKEIEIPNPERCESCEKVLEIGKPLTIVGKAVRDKDGAPTIGHVYQVFNGRIELNKMICDMESNSV